MTNFQTPYITTYLIDKIKLHANQFDNDINKYLKINAIKKLEGKCYKNFGYISKIYKVEKIPKKDLGDKLQGEILAEDLSSSAYYFLQITCKICCPLKNTLIICEVMSINKSVIHLRNGPINLLIFENSGSINQNKFVYDDAKNMLTAKFDDNKKIPIISGTFVKIKVVSLRLENNSKIILIEGTLEDIATKKEIEESIKSRESDLDDENINITTFKDYLNSDDNNNADFEGSEESEDSEDSEESEESDDTNDTDDEK
jgi:DNA-directed RNA polymerase subunit E'/Rpb7